MGVYRRIKELNYFDAYSGYLSATIHRDYFVQPKPHTQVLPFTMMAMNRISYQETGMFDDGNTVSPPVGNLIDYNMPAQGDVTRNTNTAYAKFKDKAEDTATNANNFLEMGQSFNQIAQHVKAIAKSVEAVKRGNIVAAGRALGVTVTGNLEQKIKKRSKQAANRWLELHFGWEPLVQDIGTSIDIACGTGKSGKSNQPQRIKSHFQNEGQVHIDRSHDYGGGLTDIGFDLTKWSYGTSMGAKITVTNPNLGMANQMGFVNPLSVAWEAVPFSFVVDWFANVGQVLSACSDFAGSNLSQQWTTTYQRKVRTQSLFRNYAVNPHPEDPNFRTSGGIESSAEAVVVNRTPTIVGPSLTLNAAKPLGAARGATAISLLIQSMKSA